MTDSTPQRSDLPTLDRRTLVRTVGWTLPAVSLAAAAPAFARSSFTCSPVTPTPQGSFTAWTGFTRHADTGWYYRPQSGSGWTGPGRTGYVNSEQYSYYDAYIARDTHAFLSFQDNRTSSGTTATTGRDTITAEYTFQVPAGRALVNLSGGVIFGYGNQGSNSSNVALTDRQMVSVSIVDGTTVTPVASMAPRRRSADGSVYYPSVGMHSNQYSVATAASYAMLQQSDEQVSATHTLHGPYDAGNTYFNQGRFLVPFASNDIELPGTTSRSVTVRYTMTLPDVRSGWVNDDLIIRQPSISVCVPTA